MLYILFNRRIANIIRSYTCTNLCSDKKQSQLAHTTGEENCELCTWWCQWSNNMFGICTKTKAIKSGHWQVTFSKVQSTPQKIVEKNLKIMCETIHVYGRNPSNQRYYSTPESCNTLQQTTPVKTMCHVAPFHIHPTRTGLRQEIHGPEKVKRLISVNTEEKAMDTMQK